MIDAGQVQAPRSSRPYFGQQFVGKRRDHRYRDDQRQHHRHRQRHRDVAEQLADLKF